MSDLDRDIAELLGRERERTDEVPDATRDRILARLESTIPDLRGDGGDDGGGSDNGGAPPGDAGAGAATAAAQASLGAKLGPLVLAFVTGAGTGAAVLHVVTPTPTERVVVVERPVAAAAPPVVDAGGPPSVPVEALPTVAVPRVSAPAATVAQGDSFVAERRVLDAARTALARGDADDALRSLAAHEKAYPSGALAEEREALFVRSLASAGRMDEARARASRFRAKWPKSLMLPAVEAAAGP